MLQMTLDDSYDGKCSSNGTEDNSEQDFGLHVGIPGTGIYNFRYFQSEKSMEECRSIWFSLCKASA